MIIRVIVPPTSTYRNIGYEIHYLAANGDLLFKNVTADKDNLPSQAIIDASDTEFKRRNPKLSHYKILDYEETWKSINEQEKPGSGPVGFNDVVEAVELLNKS